MLHLPRLAGVLLAIASAGSAHAQSAPPYRSALEGYQPFGDEKPVPWQQANDTVGRIGGWRAYANEAQGLAGRAGPAAAPASAPAASAPAAKDPHAGHHRKP
jgi:hypothetical protein